MLIKITQQKRREIHEIMKIGIVCYPTYGGSGVMATELGIGLAKRGHEVHFITYNQPVRLDFLSHKLHFLRILYRSPVLISVLKNLLILQ